MKVFNIVRYLPIKGFPAENDITFKIYADLENKFGVKSIFLMPLAHIPRWATCFKKTLITRYSTINKTSYHDKKYGFKVKFFQAYFPLTFFNFPIRFSYYNMRFQFSFYSKNLFSIFNSYQPDIIHAHTLFDAFYAFKLKKKTQIPYIITLRGKYSNLYKSSLSKKILKHAKYLMTPSYDIYNNLKLDYKIEIIPHGLDDIWYSNNNKKNDESSLRLVTTSRLLEMKNIQIVIKDLAVLKKKGYKISYSIIGDGSYKENLKTLVDQLGLNSEIKFYGYQTPEKIKEIYKQCDIFIMLSTPETFGRVYFEAAAQGLLVIGVKGTGAYGHFSEQEAYFIEPKVEETNKILKNMNEIIFQTMTSKSKEKVLKFSNTKIINRYYTILKNSLN